MLSVSAEYGYCRMVCGPRSTFDRAKKEIPLGRDPMGMKPLYYNASGNSLRFSSNLDLVVNNKLNICEIGKISFTMFGYTIAPFTMYEEVKQLRSGGPDETALIL